MIAKKIQSNICGMVGPFRLVTPLVYRLRKAMFPQSQIANAGGTQPTTSGKPAELKAILTKPKISLAAVTQPLTLAVTSPVSWRIDP